MNRTYAEVQRAILQYDTRDPYELLDCIGATLDIVHHYPADGLKGFAAIFNRVPHAVINGNLSSHDQRIVAGHEAAYLILHKTEILQSPGQAMQDFQMYCDSRRLEYQANQFLADFLVSDEEVMDVTYGKDFGFFHSASELHLPPELFGFKIYSMMNRGLPVKMPLDLKSDFLKS